MFLYPVYLKCDRLTCDPHKNGDGSPFPSRRVFKLPGRPTAARTPQPGLAAEVSPSAALGGDVRARGPSGFLPAHAHTAPRRRPVLLPQAGAEPHRASAALVLNTGLHGQEISKPRTQKRKGQTLTVASGHGRTTRRNAGPGGPARPGPPHRSVRDTCGQNDGREHTDLEILDLFT